MMEPSLTLYFKREHTQISIFSSLSYHPLAHKSFCCQGYCSSRVSSLSFFSGAVFTRGKKHIFDALRTIGYPKNLIQRRSISQRSETEVTKEKLVARVTLPYIQGASEAIRWDFERHEHYIHPSDS